MNPAEKEALLTELEAMPAYLCDCFAGLDAESLRARSAADVFSPIEQVWHLADLEQEGFGARIALLLTETEPELPDFDGAAVAASRGYLQRSLHAGLTAFSEARNRNLATLRAVEGESWKLAGTQEGIGRVTLCDLPSFMLQHDRAHRAEIEDWKKSRL